MVLDFSHSHILPECAEVCVQNIRYLRFRLIYMDMVCNKRQAICAILVQLDCRERRGEEEVQKKEREKEREKEEGEEK